jgi:hypothetical protein
VCRLHPVSIEQLFVDLFVQAHREPPGHRSGTGVPANHDQSPSSLCWF